MQLDFIEKSAEAEVFRLKPNGEEGRRPQFVSSLRYKGRTVQRHTVISDPAADLETAVKKLDEMKKNPLATIEAKKKRNKSST